MGEIVDCNNAHSVREWANVVKLSSLQLGDCADAGGRATQGAVAESVGVRRIKQGK